MAKVRVCVLRTAGINCDKETAFAFEKAGAAAELLHINKFICGEKKLSDYHILAIPGGFTYGDDIAAGKILANELKFKLAQDLKEFVRDGKLAIGICNGFQILVKAGLLPGNGEFSQEASLIINDSGKFEDRWVFLKSKSTARPGHIERRAGENRVQPAPAIFTGGPGRTEKCVWIKGLPEIIYLPVAHGEGKFIALDKKVLARLKKNNQIVFRYCDAQGNSAGYPDNPNGSTEGIAGICDESGRILGLMPHPERHISYLQHPRWQRIKSQATRPPEGDGLQVFKNGVEYAKKRL